MRAGAFAVIFGKERRVLLCHRRDLDAWNLPGGLVEDGEAPWDAAIREVREEIGVEAKIARLIGLYWKPDQKDLVFAFECRAVSGRPGPSEEADAVGYFKLDALPPNTLPNHAERIRDALAKRPPILRVQTGASRELFTKSP